MKFGKKDALSALASFHGDRLTLVVSLKQDEEPTSLTPESASNSFRIDMQKISDLVPDETDLLAGNAGEAPTESVAEEFGPSEDELFAARLERIRLIVLSVAGVALLVAVALVLIRKKATPKKDETLKEPGV